jgi:hypothetical protein
VSLAETLSAFFTSADFDFDVASDDGTVFRVPMSGVRGNWDLFAQVREEHAQLVFYSVCPFNASRDQMNAIMELITRINYGIVVGNFELDLDDGEIRYKTSVVGDTPDRRELAAALTANVTMFDAHLPALTAVAEGRATAAEALAELEAEADAEPAVSGDDT